MKFISSTEKVYNLEIRKQRHLSKLLKKDNTLDENTINKIVSIVTAWSICRYSNASKELYNDNNLLKLANEDKKLLLEIFNMNSLLNNLKNVLDEQEYIKFSNDDSYRRNVMFSSLFQIIIQGGKTYGAEYGLVFAKTFNFDLAIPMHYASYEQGMRDPKLKEFIEVYLKSGGSKDVYWLQSYYSEDRKNKYNMEELEYVINFLNIKQYVKK